MNNHSNLRWLFLPLDEVIEVGYNCTIGFIWVKQKHEKDMAFMDDCRMMRLTWVKSKEHKFFGDGRCGSVRSSRPPLEQLAVVASGEGVIVTSDHDPNRL